MNQNLISNINGIDIVTVEKDGEIYVPIKPICQALEINHVTQMEKLKSDPTFSGSVVPLRGITAADGKQYEMLCLPLMLVFLWLGSINPANVAEKAKSAVMGYRLECARVLYEHFTGSMRRTVEANKKEIELLQRINSAISDEKAAKSRRKEAETALEKFREERLSSQKLLF